MIKPLIAAALAIAAFPASAANAPHLPITTLDQLAKPLPYPYDERANADRAVAAARAQGKASGKKLLIDLGGNWCPDCRILAGVMEVPALKAFLARHYVIVTVDIGRLDKNRQIAAHYGITSLAGVPALLIVDPKTDRLVNRDRLFALADARNMTTQGLADWLAQWV